MDKEYQDDVKKKFNKILKRTLQFALSVSVFSFFVWQSSGFSVLPHCFTAYFSTCLFSMLTCTLERKYMFLICNAILAFLAMPPFDIEFHASLMVEEEESIEQAKRREENSEHGTETLFIETNGRVVSEASIVEDVEETDEEEGGTGVMVAQDDELVADTTMETNEELNRKFEEFIRKMKEEMRIEAQGQPIAA